MLSPLLKSSELDVVTRCRPVNCFFQVSASSSPSSPRWPSFTPQAGSQALNSPISLIHFVSVVARHQFDADTDPDPIIHFYAYPDPDPTPNFTHVRKLETYFFFTFIQSSARLSCFTFLLSVSGAIIFFYNIVKFFGGKFI